MPFTLMCHPSPERTILMCHPEPAGEGSRPSVAPADASKLSLFPLHCLPRDVILAGGAMRRQAALPRGHLGSAPLALEVGVNVLSCVLQHT